MSQYLKYLQRAFSIVSCLFFSSFLYAQSTSIQVNQLPVNPFSFGSKDLWQVNIVNPLPAQQVILKARISSISGITLLDAVSAPVQLEQGQTVFGPVNVQTTSITYYRNNVQQTDLQQRSFPAGNYNYCITVFSGNTEIGQSCEDIALTPVTPPILILPANEEELDHTLPFFSWLPPVPGSSTMQYTLVIAEVHAQQTPEDAILRNPSVFSTSAIGTNSFQYPITAYALEKGKDYAWQVKAYEPGNMGESVNDDMMAGTSEVFVFHILNDSIPKPKVETSYAVLNQFDMENSTTMVKYLKFIYYEPYEEGELHGVITDEEGRLITSTPLEFTTVNGENAYEVDLTRYNLSEDETYKFNVKSSHREKFILQFTFRYAQ